MLALFAMLAYTGLRIARRVEDPFRRLVAAAITIWFVGQAIINIGGVVGLMPITGLPLPFISDGGSALVVALGAAGMLGLRPRRTRRGQSHARPSAAGGCDYSGRRCRRCRAHARRATVTSPRHARRVVPAPDGSGPDGAAEGALMAALRSVVLAGGGTGGHIYPLLAFADCLRRHDPACGSPASERRRGWRARSSRRAATTCATSRPTSCPAR